MIITVEQSLTRRLTRCLTVGPGAAWLVSSASGQLRCGRNASEHGHVFDVSGRAVSWPGTTSEPPVRLYTGPDEPQQTAPPRRDSHSTAMALGSPAAESA